MSKTEKIKLGISIGDINGIGIEIILKTFLDKRMLEFCTPIVFGSTKYISAYKKSLNLNVQYNGVFNVEKAVEGKINVVNIWKEDVPVEFGNPTKRAGEYAFKSLEAATNSLANNEIDVLVTAPINKDNIQSEDFTFPGHTEYLESKLEGKSLMILMTENLKVGLVTGHIPISEVSSAISEEAITDKVEILYKTLIEDFGVSRPKIAVLGLNPHCGDNGLIGIEDDEIVRPTLIKIQEQGKLVYGPYAADSFFGSENYKNFDAILAMYHDQGLAPFKTLSFGEGVNYTAGLNKIRTSPDHGTAYELAGKDKASISSFKEAVFTAIKLFSKREEYKSLTQNVLKTNSKNKML
ncbi:4-hydroxythreonine-4-phosphate dehydrogenase PdxA [Lutibacter sp. TH_r2]|uniref:4-hydroxythreonine-4-phosphate dehydrogenase PdxA n=1 Tax=Lutibacter sp. TH_r2 TaxID=3082083 RepID=UPI0029550CC0|nr:4-hydroxythreonine-4-phosphate dehydrogenase PdxA [Lutibacter sp. TH_r2]MDV7186182.1 4-hydroxythreonine-4-phosphate dehydrogenase PdxA [Lutibacter sp. TH_r2]